VVSIAMSVFKHSGGVMEIKEPFYDISPGQILI
jgi:hypothetical protein